MVIDAHAHLSVFSGKLIPLKERVNNLKTLMKKNKISKSLILSGMEESEHYPSIKELLMVLKNKPNLLLIGTVNITSPNNYNKIKELRILLKEKKIIGLKLYPGYQAFYPNDKICEPIYDLCEEFNVPAIMHSGETFGKGKGMRYSKPEYIDEVAIKRPNLKIIIAHLGNPWINDTMVILNRNKNVYADIGGLVWNSFDGFWSKYYQHEIMKVINWCHDKNVKLLFGTDWPCCDTSSYNSLTGSYIKLVNSLKISKESKEQIFHKNAERLFKI